MTTNDTPPYSALEGISKRKPEWNRNVLILFWLTQSAALWFSEYVTFILVLLSAYSGYVVFILPLIAVLVGNFVSFIEVLTEAHYYGTGNLNVGRYKKTQTVKLVWICGVIVVITLVMAGQNDFGFPGLLLALLLGTATCAPFWGALYYARIFNREFLGGQAEGLGVRLV